MSVSGITSGSTSSEISAIMQNLRSSLTKSDSTDETSSSASSTDSTKLSGQAEFLNKLEQLKTEDPEKFKELLQGVAEKLTSAAESSTNEQDKKMLTSLAEKFTSVANGGDLSQLNPPKPPSLNSTGTQAYGVGNQSEKMMGPQGMPPGPPPESAEEEDQTSSTDSSTTSSTDIHTSLKSIFDTLNTELTEALSS